MSTSSSGSPDPDPERDGSGSNEADGDRQRVGGEGEAVQDCDGGAEGDSAKKQVGKKQRRAGFGSRQIMGILQRLINCAMGVFARVL